MRTQEASVPEPQEQGGMNHLFQLETCCLIVVSQYTHFSYSRFPVNVSEGRNLNDRDMLFISLSNDVSVQCFHRDCPAPSRGHSVHHDGITI